MVTTTASSPKQHLPFFPARLSDGGLAGQAQSPDPSHRQGAPSLARAPRPSEGWDVTASLYWPKAMSVRSSALQVGEVKLQLEEGSVPYLEHPKSVSGELLSLLLSLPQNSQKEGTAEAPNPRPEDAQQSRLDQSLGHATQFPSIQD